jgi:hypothetical protein
MHADIVPSRNGPLFFWNVDGAVGKNGKNKFEDVLFVQWCFYKLMKWPLVGPELRDEIEKIGVDGDCNGRDGDKLVEGIKALQRFLNLMVDGRVSPVSTKGQYVDHGSKSTFLIIYPLNAVVAQMYPTLWPRIDQMPQFVWRIKSQAQAPFNWG